MPPINPSKASLVILALALVGAFGASDACFAQDAEKQQLIELNDQMLAADKAKKNAELERLARSYLAIAERRREPLLIMVGNMWLGRAHMGQEQFRLAETHLKKTYELASRHHPSFGIGVLTDLGLVYKELAQYDDAERTYQLAIREIEKEEGPQAARLIGPLINLASLYQGLFRVKESRIQYERAKELLEKQPQTDWFRLQMVIYGLAVNRYKEFRYAESEAFYLQSAEILERLPKIQRRNLAYVYGGLHLLYRVTHRISLAEEAGERSLKIAEEEFGPNHSNTAHSILLMSDFYREQGRFSESEALARRGVTISEAIYGRQHPNTAESVENLAKVLIDQGRMKESLSLMQRVAAIFRATFPQTDYRVHRTTASVGYLLGQLGQFQAAEAALKQALATVPRDSFNASVVYVSLAQVYMKQQRFAAAEQLLLESLKVKEEDHGLRKDDPRLRGTLAALVATYLQQQKFAAAKPYAERLVGILEANPLARGELAQALTQRAIIALGESRLADAQTYLLRAMEEIETQRAQFSGGDFERSQAFGQLTPVYELMVALQVELGEMSEALSAMERGRSRGLLDQLAVQGIDLLDGVPAEQVQEFQRRLTDVASRQAQIDQQLQVLQTQELEPAALQRRRNELLSAARAAQADYVVVQSDIRNVSPAYRLALGKDRRPVALDALQAYLQANQTLMLRYLIGADGSYVLVVPPTGKPRLEKLLVDDTTAKTLGIPAGPLNAERLNHAFANESAEGVMQLFRRARQEDAALQLTPKLAALWTLLIPAAERQTLVSGEHQRLLVVPDGALSTLPFAALVVEPGDDPVYALDVAPPILYAPSATILYNLVERTDKSVIPMRKPVLTVGDANYGEPAAEAADTLTARARYGRLGGPLNSLPYSGLESQWVSQVFGRQGVEVGQLSKGTATERSVVFNIPGRQIVHLACHGLADQTYGNLFGALAFTPERGASTAQDGLLTLAEIYNLDMRGCELTILSACDTNVGPQQKGEGVWALSRGFLVAGSRRVVASNWVVDDKAAASLISYYCGFLANATAKDETPDYATCLRDARRWVRQQEAWRSPYYWATFVHVGPN